ncbi:adaptin N terminal region-domain-containing protein [Umbelopsis sp. AD052]|nr:adaptin N terminal region-domain-containing protein [Umbelopsis sp. AD052]
MISKGRDVSEFFPDVVKNVVSQNIEIRKLVYIYLLRYAEQEPDLALLSINTFQKDLGDKNQIIRAMALRVMSGIRVPVISPIVLLGIKKCVADMSPYVRKTAAHAIPKCYSLDPTQEDSLIEIISGLLKDRSAITIGSTIMAFNEVCPTRFDLIHPYYRKLCNMLTDLDEWGQIAALDLLLRYGRNQFTNPNPNGIKVPKTATLSSTKKESFYSDSSDDEESTEEVEEQSEVEDVELDEDHSLLIKSCLPLLQSRNSGVVMAVARIYFHLAPSEEAAQLAKPLVRLLRSHRELQYVILTNIATMACSRPYLFHGYLSQFYVRSTDSVFIRNTKLDILTAIVTEQNINSILGELQQYVKSPNKDFVASTIQAIGKCAMTVPETADRCMKGLMKLLKSTNDLVVAESVSVIKRLLQIRGNENTQSIIRLAKLLDKTTVPVARANIFWLVGQYTENISAAAPDILRKGVKGFTEEHDVVKYQILTLSAKLTCLNPGHETISLLNQYVLNLARYDQNYDIRDRARLLRSLTLPTSAQAEKSDSNDDSHVLSSHLKQILLSDKEPPVLESDMQDRAEYTLGSLSMMVKHSLPGYEPIPDYPQEQPDPSVRDVEEDFWNSVGQARVVEQGFGSDSFESRYRDGSGRSPASTAFSSVEARGYNVVHSQTPKAKKNGEDYDLEAFYNDTSEEEETLSSEDSEATTSEEDSEEEEEDEDEEESEEESDDLDAGAEKRPLRR